LNNVVVVDVKTPSNPCVLDETLDPSDKFNLYIDSGLVLRRIKEITAAVNYYSRTEIAPEKEVLYEAG